MSMAPIVVITVDTEEDEWGNYGSRHPATENIGRLPEFQRLCERYGALPTYLVNWPVTSNAKSADILADLFIQGDCEIGTHIHPWNTPPVEEETGEWTSMLSNLPRDLIQRKLSALHEQIEQRLRCSPTSFRAGRWGFSAAVADALVGLGYRVDSSVSPYIDWTAACGPDYRHAPTTAYRFAPNDPLLPNASGELIEIPATIGFLGGRPRAGMRLREWAFRPVPRRLRMVGVLDRLGVATLRWLSPEVSTGSELIRLARTLVNSGAAYLNFTFHSPTLSTGLTPFVRTELERTEFMARIEEFLSFASAEGYRFDTLARVPALLGLTDGS